MLRRQGGKVTVLAFYPKDFTSGCTAEMRTFTDRYDDLFGGDVVVVGISADSLESHRQFAASVGAPFRLLSDPSQRVAARYGSKGDNGYNRRTVYVIDARGRVAYRDMRFGALDPKSYDRLKAAVRSARSSGVAKAFRMLVGGGLLAAALAPGLAAQRTGAAPTGISWTLDTLRSGFCVHFLVEPAASSRGIFRGVAQRPASATPALNAVLKRTVDASPELASWIPQRFCVLQFSAVGVGNRDLRDTKHGRSQVVATWSTSARLTPPARWCSW